MENKIVTMASKKFGTVRKIFEGDKVIFCGVDIAKALGYKVPKDAISAHCKGAVKRRTPTNGGNQQMSFIPEADVYRLICHSKLPSALEFEKWVFEDVVPKAVNEKLPSKPKQPALETSEYHYFPKTLNGEPVITIADFEHFTGILGCNVYKPLKKLCKLNSEYYSLSNASMLQYKRENPNVSRLMSVCVVLKAPAVRKLLKHFKLSVEIPMIEGKPVEKKVSGSFSRRPSSAMESLMSYIQRESRAIEGIANMLLCPDTKDNYESYRKLLIWRIKDLRDYCSDIELIKI